MSEHLYHYTCAHGRLALGEGGALLPPLWQIDEIPSGFPPAALTLLGLVWATEEARPDRYALGLTSATISCDRLAHRYAVPSWQFARWGRVRSRFPVAVVEALETARGAQPAMWLVAEGPVDGATLDHSYEGAR